MNKDRLIEVLNMAYPEIGVFGDDIKQEEVASNPSFFMFRKTYDYSRGSLSPRNLMRKVLVQFVTKENKKIDLELLIPQLQTAGMFFINSYEELGKIQGTDNQALMITMEFSTQVRKCLI